MAPPPSPERSARHLLRHLDDPAALRANALVAAFFGDGAAHEGLDARHEAFLAWVRRGIEALGASCSPNALLRRAILLRCDLEGTPHKVAIAELGVSRRTFYYERREALRRLGESLLTKREPRWSVAGDALDTFEVRLSKALSLDALGDAEAARAELLDLTAGADHQSQRVRALSAAIQVDVDCDRSLGLEALVRELTVQRDALELRAGTDLSAWLDAETSLATVGGTRPGPNDVCARLQAVEDVAARSAFALDERVCESRARALVLLADVSSSTGLPDLALGALRSAGALLAHVPEPPPSLRARIHIGRALALLALDRPLADSSAEAHAALQVSRRYGLLPYLADASAALAMIESASGRFDGARRIAGGALPVARQLAGHSSALYLYWSAARVQAMTGELDRAFATAAEAERAMPDANRMAAVRDFSRAYLELAARRPERAARFARVAGVTSERLGLLRVAGRSFAIRAQALAAIDRPKEARLAADTAVVLLERHGTRHSLAAAYDVSAKLTRNRKHALLASELRDLLMRPASTETH
jgi:hypothetical protein